MMSMSGRLLGRRRANCLKYEEEEEEEGGGGGGGGGGGRRGGGGGGKPLLWSQEKGE